MEYTNFFSGVQDYRVQGRIQHHLNDILMLSLCAVLSGADDFEEIEDYGKEKEEFLKSFLLLPNGIPSHDTINRVFEHICPKEFLSCLSQETKSILDLLSKRRISIDGKVLRATREQGKANSGLCIVSAWANDISLTLGQLRVAKKSNEKTAIPELISTLDLDKSLVSIDAIACQKGVAKQISEAGGDYILALKKNQKILYEQAMYEFERQKSSLNSDTWIDFGSGRIETRKAYVLDNLCFVDQAKDWKNLRSIFIIEAQREKGDKLQKQTRLYISSLNISPKEANIHIREHWSIENSLHWQLDVTFKEDRSRCKKGNAPDNMNILRKTALNLLKRTKGKESMKNKRKKAGWNDKFLLEILKTCDF